MYHGDFDWPGLQIGNRMMRTWQAQPWRFSARDYEAAVTSAPLERQPIRCLRNGFVGSGSAANNQRCGIAIAEEAVATSLLEDLRRIIGISAI